MNLRVRICSCVAVALTLTVGGCATYRPDPLDPQAELHALRQRDLSSVVVKRAGHDGTGGIAAAVPFDPTDGLDDAEVVSVALVLNPQLVAKRLEVGEAGAALITAGLWPNPEVGVGWRAGIGGSSGYNFEADALFQLLRPGERAARRGAAEARVAEVRADVVAAEFETVSAARARWLAVLAAEQIGRLLDEEVALRQRRRIGEGTELEGSVVELELAEARRDRRKAQTDLEAERRELNRILGLPPEYALRLSDAGRPLVVTVLDELADDDVDRLILDGRPELRTAPAAYDRAEHELRLAVLGQYPRLGLGPSFERDLDGGKALGLGLSLELPLLNQNQGEIAAKAA